ncbi:MAG TPA: molybdopterin-synthase adenylyltransferase MoeB [Anaerolineae bacterium]|nr:molybdopterin-synthase adenylyltransferase MoeB [Anaerolineae bacterium]
MFGFTEDQIKRYARHIVLPGVGGKGQRRLLQAKVLVIGAGGLGSPAALYLAAAGVGTIGIVDSDAVDVSNLQRQVLFKPADTGRSKVEAAAGVLRALNPDVTVMPCAERLTSANARAILSDYDVVIDGSDNFPTRYLVNDVCVMSEIPFVWGAANQFDGQLSVVKPRRSACYRCLFPAPPPPGSVPDCIEAGVIGALTGTIGSWLALEAIKLVLGLGEVLADRLTIFEGLSGAVTPVQVARRTDCAVCGDAPSVTELIDYELFCGRQTTSAR